MREELSTFTALEEWLVAKMGRGLETGVFESSEDAHPEPLLAYRIGDLAMVRVVEKMGEQVRSVVDGLSDDELFSLFGVYELARVTLPHDVSIWGPTLYYFGNADTFQPSEREIAVQLTKEELDEVANPRLFWHCDWEQSVANFGVFEDDRLVALTTVHDYGDPVYAIGVDVVPGSEHRGLGRAVMTGACRWVIDQGRVILATSAQWNIPSVRLQRSMGLRYVFSDLHGSSGSFKVPPQTLGKPRPDAEMHDLYPLWAQNKEIIRYGESYE